MVLWIIGAVISINMIYLSLVPLLNDVNVGISDGRAINLREFLSGTGVATSGFWLRVLAIIAGLAFLLAWPHGSRARRMTYTKIRAISSLIMSALFIYVTILTCIYVPGGFINLIWIQSGAYAVIMGITYLANSAEIRKFNRAKEVLSHGGQDGTS